MNAKQILVAALLCLAAGCAASESQVRSVVQKNPDIVFEAIENNPEKFMATVQKAAQTAQRSSYEREVATIKEQQEKDVATPKQPKLSADRRLMGEDKSKITIVEYADFQCPACGVAHKELSRFLDNHAGNVQFYFKNMPLDFHKMALPAARYFEAIRLQDRGHAERFFNYVFENQASMENESFLKNAASQAGADLKRLALDIKSKQIDKILDADRDEFSKFGFTGTPVIILNGVAMPGAQPLTELERVAERTKK